MYVMYVCMYVCMYVMYVCMYALKRTNTFHHCLEHFASRARANELLTIPRTDGYKRTCMYVCMYVCMSAILLMCVLYVMHDTLYVCEELLASELGTLLRAGGIRIGRREKRLVVRLQVTHRICFPDHTYIRTYIHIYTLERESL